MSKYQTVPTCREYHPNSELRGREGYYPNITTKQLDAVNQLAERISSEQLNINTDEEEEFLKLLRFLRARKFNVDQAFSMLKEDVIWRQQENRINLRNELAEDVLGCELDKMYKYFPCWIQGFDKQLRPVSYRKFGYLEIWNVLKLTSMKQLLRFHAWETEQALRNMYQRSAEANCNIETFVIVVDALGWNMSLATSDAFTFIKGMASTDSDHYPERLGNVIVINAPTMLSFAWRVVQGFLDNVTKQKVKIVSTNNDKSEIVKVLQEYIDIDQIPEQYGGTLPDLLPDQAIQSMNPVMANKQSNGEKQYLYARQDGAIDSDSYQIITSHIHCDVYTDLRTDNVDCQATLKHKRSVATKDSSTQTENIEQIELVKYRGCSCVVS